MEPPTQQRSKCLLRIYPRMVNPPPDGPSRNPSSHRRHQLAAVVAVILRAAAGNLPPSGCDGPRGASKNHPREDGPRERRGHRW